MIILLVANDATFLKDLKIKLKKKLSKAVAVIALGAKEALNKINKEDIDIIVTDYKMPLIDGVELLNIIGKDHPKIKRIILTGHPDAKTQKERMKKNFYYLEKPCKIDELVNTINYAIAN